MPNLNKLFGGAGATAQTHVVVTCEGADVVRETPSKLRKRILALTARGLRVEVSSCGGRVMSSYEPRSRG